MAQPESAQPLPAGRASTPEERRNRIEVQAYLRYLERGGTPAQRLMLSRGRRRAWRLWIAAWLNGGRRRPAFPPGFTNQGWSLPRPQ